KSLEYVMKFLKRDEQQCLNARQEATNVLMDIDYLNVLQTFESLLLSAASDKSHQDCTDRDILASCLKFVWESYKQSFSVNFQSSETQALHLETHLVQLDKAIAMELWQVVYDKEKKRNNL
ncbi:unnamed protein product, partial [Rotaria sordida]